MAVQFEVAFGQSLVGTGVVAGGAYGCSMGSATTAALTCTCPYQDQAYSGPLGLMPAVSSQHCMQLPERIMAERAISAVRANGDLVDGLDVLRRHRVWLFGGGQDPVVHPTTIKGLAQFYRQAKVHALKVVNMPLAGHGLPVADDAAPCQSTRAPFLNDCRLDGAGQMLRWIYKLPRSARPLAQQADALHPFDQRPYRPAMEVDGLDDVGWLYVPKACEKAGAHCKLHVVFHGCEQGQDMAFVRGAGFNRWAEGIGAVVLYPQVRAQSPLNPKGCWDFWGYTTASTHQDGPPHSLSFGNKKAPQLRAVKAMVDALLAKPTALASTSP